MYNNTTCIQLTKYPLIFTPHDHCGPTAHHTRGPDSTSICTEPTSNPHARPNKHAGPFRGCVMRDQRPRSPGQLRVQLCWKTTAARRSAASHVTAPDGIVTVTALCDSEPETTERGHRSVTDAVSVWSCMYVPGRRHRPLASPADRPNGWRGPARPIENSNSQWDQKGLSLAVSEE